MKSFFDIVRPQFGKLSQTQVDALAALVKRGLDAGIPLPQLAYILATIQHETAKWMVPIREGAIRFGPDYTDAQAKAAVRALFAKKIIRTDYSTPAGQYHQSYYGRGLIQITWLDNYRKFAAILGIPLEENPDLALEWGTAVEIAFIGMLEGTFTGKALKNYNLPAEFKQARAIVNGDVSKNGQAIADIAVVYLRALETLPKPVCPTCGK